MLGLLSGCATGSSLSISQAPLSFVLTEDGSYEIGAQQDGTAQALAERGDLEHGVPGYDALGGNALLPVSAVVLPDPLRAVSSVGALGPSLISVVAAPGQAALSADLAGQAQVAASAALPAVPGTPALASTVNSVLTPVTSTPLAPSVSVAAAVPSVTSVAAPVVTTANQSLTTVSSVLAGVAPPVAPAASAAGNPILATLAAALGKRCC